MRQLFWPIVVASSILTNIALAQTNAPALISPDSISWRGSPLMPGNEIGSVLGAPSKPGLYIFRVKMPAGARIPPHTHPDERNTTVLAGTIWVGVGETFDESKVVAVPTGAVYVVPANLPHYVWAKDGDAMYQESGIGPSATTVIKR